ncbi:MAG: hypothetical protein ABIH46_09480, partial [Chloroflexota bacterium]
MENQEQDHKQTSSAWWRRKTYGLAALTAALLIAIVLIVVLNPFSSPPSSPPSEPTAFIPAEGLSLAIDQKAIASGIKVKGKVEDKLPPLPQSTAAVSRFYSFETQGSTDVHAKVTLPLSEEVIQHDLLDAYGWRQEGGWQWIGPVSLSEDGKSGQADCRSIPLNIVVVRATDYPVQITGWAPRPQLSQKASGLISVLHLRGYSVAADGTVKGTIQKPATSGTYLLVPTISGA